MTLTAFFFQALLALLGLGLMVYLPGRGLLRLLQLRLTPPEHLAASLAAGMAGFVFVFWGLSLLHLQFLIWLYLAVPGLEVWMMWQDRRRCQWIPPNPDLPAEETWFQHWPLGVVVLLGILLQTRFTAWTAWETELGMQFLAWHAHDAPWHVYNILQMASVFPPEMPGFAGRALENYHIFSDLLWGGFRHLAPIDPWHLYFRIAPLLYSALLTLGAFVAGRTWSGQQRVGYSAALLTVLASNFGYVMPLFFGADKYFFWDSIFWVQSPYGMIFNPGVSASFGLVWIGLWALARWLRERRTGFLVVLALLWGVLPGFKVYPGLLMLAGMLAAGLWMFMFQRKTGLLTAFLWTLPGFLLVLLPPVIHAPSLIRLLPGYNLGAMLVAPDRMGLMSSASLKLLFVEKPWLVALLMAGLALVFLLGNLGVRSLGLIPMARNLLKPRDTEPLLLFITAVVAGAFAASIFFVQTGVQWNTIQFFYYAVLLSSLPASRQFWTWAEAWPRPRAWAAAGVLLAMSLPGTLQSLWAVNFHYDLSAQTLAGLHWIKQHSRPGQRVVRPLPDTLMTEAGWKQFQRNQERGRMTSLKAWQADAAASTTTAAVDPSGQTTTASAAIPEPGNTTPTASAAPAGQERTDTAIVAAITGLNTYLEDTVSAQIMGYPMEARARQVLHFYTAADPVEAREFLEKENISYVILYRGMRLPFDHEGVPLRKAFENQAMTVYQYIFLGGW